MGVSYSHTVRQHFAMTLEHLTGSYRIVPSSAWRAGEKIVLVLILTCSTVSTRCVLAYTCGNYHLKTRPLLLDCILHSTCNTIISHSLEELTYTTASHHHKLLSIRSTIVHKGVYIDQGISLANSGKPRHYAREGPSARLSPHKLYLRSITIA